jgi:hypothetical protein
MHSDFPQGLWPTLKLARSFKIKIFWRNKEIFTVLVS